MVQIHLPQPITNFTLINLSKLFNIYIFHIFTTLSNLILKGPEKELKLTQNTQPAIMTVGVSIFNVLNHQFGLDLNNSKFFAGHSLGGMIAPAYALKFPDHVISVGLLSTVAGRSEEDSKKVWNVINEMEKNGIEKTLQTLTNRWFTDEFIKNNPDLVERRLKQVVDTDSEVFLNVFKIYAKTEMLLWLKNISKPCLLLTGENDGGCSPRLNHLIADSLSNSELCILKNYKHSLLIEAPHEVGEKVHEFLLKQS